MVNDVPPKDRDIAMVFQNYALYPHMNVFENMAFGLRIRKVEEEEIKRRVIEAAKLLDIDQLLHRFPKQLSGGQRQRVAMGRAIVRNPSVFLFDEPLSNLDAKLRTQMRSELARLHKRIGATTIYVTHDQVEAMTLADKIVIMNNGIVQQIGPPLEIYNRPKNLFVAGFIGSPTMNFIECKFRKENDRCLLRGDNWYFEIPPVYEPDNSDVILGIRPENIFPVDPINAIFKGVLEIKEVLGSELYLYVNCGSFTLCLRQEASHKFDIGETIYLNFKPETIRLFNKTSGLRVNKKEEEKK
ncbi:MAG: ATP-binding cassette domain-containing protein [Deltaproteobacteria bacterium]|nr:ATP-binding cassette domain-containing protein [Deltaproteobacteria bacterium]